MMAMLRGIDISNHQGKAGLSSLAPLLPNVDFVICKATGGTSFVDAWCDIYVQQCIAAGKPWGFYHFAHDDGKGASALEEADYFMANCKNYFQDGIPVLDWERDTVSVSWVNAFVRRVHDATGVWPWIYANPWRFNQGGVEKNCGRWIADYPNITRPAIDWELPSVPDTDGAVCCWQFASDGRVKGWSGNLCVDAFFGNAEAWEAYAAGDSRKDREPSIDVLENDRYTVTITEK